MISDGHDFGSGMSSERAIAHLAARSIGMKTVGQNRVAEGNRARAGVVLLIMLGMLAIFTLIAATFVISAGHFRRGATSASRAEQTGDSFEVLLQQALMQVIRGSRN